MRRVYKSPGLGPEIVMIKCMTKGCSCPGSARGDHQYTFRYINNQQHFIYYDVPKVGSSSLRRMLFPRSWPLSNVSPCIDSVRTNMISGVEYISFTFVRNPYDRIVSTWKYFTTNSWAIGRMKKNNITVDQNTTFEGFLDIVINQHSDHHWQPQCDYVPDDVQFIGRLENFQSDYDELCDLIDIPKSKLIHEKKSNRGHYSEYYNEGTKKIVDDVYSQDIERFGYTFE